MAGKKGLGVAVVATLAAPVVLYFAFRTAAVGLSSAAAAILPPVDTSPGLRPLIRAAAHPQWSPPPGVTKALRQAAVTAPLAFEPYLLLGRIAAREGDLARAIRLTEEARRRRPTYLATRVQLMEYYGKARAYSEFLGEMDFVLRKSPEARKVIFPPLVQLIRDPMGRAALASVLVQDPEWRKGFIAAAKTEELSPDETGALLALVETGRTRDISPERGLYLHSLAEAGRYGAARTLWLQALPPPVRQGTGLIFDGNFQGLKADEPFAWVLHDRAAGRAETTGSDSGQPHLEVNYFGGSNMILAEQTLALSPGRYSFGVEARSETGVPAGRLYWRITCLPGSTELTRWTFPQQAQPAYRSVKASFTVPASDCTGQRLALIAEAGGVPTSLNAEIRVVEVKSES